MTMMDNLYGFGMRLGAGDKDNSALIDINNNIIYGELPIPDCPDSNNGDYCWKKNKEALMPGAFNKAKGNHAKSDELPYMKITGNSWSGRTHFSNNLIKNFDKTKMGKKMVVLGSSPYDSDYTQTNYFFDNKFENIGEESFAWLSSPDPSWARLDLGCGNYPCTAPHQVLNRFVRNQYTGTVPKNMASTFQLIADNPGFSKFLKPHKGGCIKKEKWNAYMCDEPKLSILIFESNDYDAWDRSMQPIYLNEEGTEQKNNLNSYLDHSWQGIYSE